MMISDALFLKGLHINPDITPHDLRPGPVRPPEGKSQIAARIEDGEAIMSAQDFGTLLAANCDLDTRLQSAEWREQVWRARCNLACVFAALAACSTVAIWLVKP